MDLSYKAEERDRKTHGRTGDRKFSIKFSYNLLEGDSWSNSGGIILGMFPALVVFKHHLAILGLARNADLYPRFDSDDFFNLSPVLLQGTAVSLELDLLLWLLWHLLATPMSLLVFGSKDC
ncbi:hypothetical protein OIU78_023982 [Salix suchowensis]|nr:hypothetical protein OIU78_023982 [Salix suchowensis]